MNQMLRGVVTSRLRAGRAAIAGPRPGRQVRHDLGLQGRLVRRLHRRLRHRRLGRQGRQHRDARRDRRLVARRHLEGLHGGGPAAPGRPGHPERPAHAGRVDWRPIPVGDLMSGLDRGRPALVEPVDPLAGASPMSRTSRARRCSRRRRPSRPPVPPSPQPAPIAMRRPEQQPDGRPAAGAKGSDASVLLRTPAAATVPQRCGEVARRPSRRDGGALRRIADVSGTSRTPSPPREEARRSPSPRSGEGTVHRPTACRAAP
jgi:hypothetical protein